MNPKLAKAIRIICMIFMGVTALLNLVGGAGTICAAFFTENYAESLSFIQGFSWVYKILMILTIATGVANIWAIVQLAKRRKNAFKQAIFILVIGVVLGAIQVFTSRALGGKGIPANMKMYINIITLILFLIFGIPGLKQKIGWDKDAAEGENDIAGGTAAIIGGILSLTVFFWAGPSHTYQGVNWVYEFETLLLVTGTSLLIGGAFLIGRQIAHKLTAPQEETAQIK